MIYLQAIGRGESGNLPLACGPDEAGGAGDKFHLLKGPEGKDHTLYASHAGWENRATFEAWTKNIVPAPGRSTTSLLTPA